jgi:hypothetical protein
MTVNQITVSPNDGLKRDVDSEERNKLVVKAEASDAIAKA